MARDSRSLYVKPGGGAALWPGSLSEGAIRNTPAGLQLDFAGGNSYSSRMRLQQLPGVGIRGRSIGLGIAE